ncbi:TonB-dependent receptor [Nibrella viscosa]|uniref:TonB-dependent receptor n=1 Tax=Nibrella viscosa TaxID=1084524 RepID=A0ABP8KAD5_9BACT
MKTLLIVLLSLFCRFVWAQTTLTGQVTDRKGVPLPGANVFIKGTYDGGSTDTTGRYRFRTDQGDTATVTVSYVGYESFEQAIRLTQPVTQLNIRLAEVSNMLNTVVITAGAFEASDEKRITILKPLDIVTTASGGADIFSVMQLLPGASRVGEQEGLFVRGGSAAETNTIIDGMVVQNPFYSGGPNMAQRSRFSPFLFKGTSFSTGGYSAQYGQALSSVLLLNTQDKLPESVGANVSVNLAGVAATAYAGDKLAVTGFYNNLKPLFALVPQNVNWLHIPETGGGSLTFRQPVGKHGLLKHYTNLDGRYMAMQFGDFSADYALNTYRVRATNLFSTTTYQTSWDEGNWLLLSGISYSRNNERIGIDSLGVQRHEQRTQARLVLTRILSDKVSLLGGGEVNQYRYSDRYDVWIRTLTDYYSALFTEAEVYFTRQLAVRLGVRGEHSSVLGRFNMAPRLSMAYKTGMYSQVALAAGQFYQTPENRYLLTRQPLRFEQARHLILNYQLIRNNRTFRIEGYYKNYAQLVREYANGPFDPNRYRYPTGPIDNSGHGYAQGIEVFWRDKKTLRYADYWVSYSYLDTKRLFANYPTPAMPTFASRHNLNIVYKHYIPALKTNLSATYAYTAGRPYYNPQGERFLADRTPAFSSVGLSASYITRLAGNFLVIYASVDNLLGTRNIFGYRYSADGGQKFPIIPPVYRSFFVGFSLNIGQKMALPDEAR